MYRTVLPVTKRRTELGSKIYLNLKTELVCNTLIFCIFTELTVSSSEGDNCLRRGENCKMHWNKHKIFVSLVKSQVISFENRLLHTFGINTEQYVARTQKLLHSSENQLSKQA